MRALTGLAFVQINTVGRASRAPSGSLSAQLSIFGADGPAADPAPSPRVIVFNGNANSFEVALVRGRVREEVLVLRGVRRLVSIDRLQMRSHLRSSQRLRRNDFDLGTKSEQPPVEAIVVLDGGP